jgi:peptidoglycan/xylan/chitin deacetylase (PgdA/CDA1 family)
MAPHKAKDHRNQESQGAVDGRRTPGEHTMDQPGKGLFPEEIEGEVYQELYQQTRQDFRHVRVRGFFKKTFLLVISILALTGLGSTLLYLTFIRDRLAGLRDEIDRYRGQLTSLNREMQKLSASEHLYKTQVDEYRNVFSNLVIEDARLIDVDLTELVRESIEGYEPGGHEYFNISRGNVSFPETALTFDLGTGEDLPQVYAVLNRLGARATVFLSNEMASTEYGSLFRDRNLFYLTKMGEMGCEFGNHTWSHYHLKYSIYETSRRRRLHLSFISDEVLDELSLMLEFDLVRKRFKEATGFDLSPIWRAPYGAIDHRILSVAAKAGYPYHVLWSGNELGPLDFFDYEKQRTVRVYDNEKNRYTMVRNPSYFTSGEMLQRMKAWEHADPMGLSGAISIAHLGTSRKIDKMVRILPEYISHFQSMGYRFVTVSEVMNEREDY